MAKKQLILQPPNEKQKLFLEAITKHVGFGGARGGGKSWVVRLKAILLALFFAGIKILIVRRTFPELVNNHINPLREILHGIAKYNKTEKVFSFPNGSTIKFGYCNNDKDLDQYQGAEYDIIFLDEATQLQEMWIKKITACVRGVNNFPKRIYYTCNPGGASHGYFKRLFIDKKYEDGEDPNDYTFIQSLVTDNKALMASQPDYIKQLEALPPKLREAWLYGRWDIFEGQFFEDFRTTPDIQKCVEAGITEEEPVFLAGDTEILTSLPVSTDTAQITVAYQQIVRSNRVCILHKDPAVFRDHAVTGIHHIRGRFRAAGRGVGINAAADRALVLDHIPSETALAHQFMGCGQVKDHFRAVYRQLRATGLGCQQILADLDTHHGIVTQTEHLSGIHADKSAVLVVNTQFGCVQPDFLQLGTGGKPALFAGFQTGFGYQTAEDALFHHRGAVIQLGANAHRQAEHHRDPGMPGRTAGNLPHTCLDRIGQRILKEQVCAGKAC
mgnify:CR=1 FL=1